MDSPYFDGCYFDPTYFDASECTTPPVVPSTGGHGDWPVPRMRRRIRVAPADPLTDDEDAILTLEGL